MGEKESIHRKEGSAAPHSKISPERMNSFHYFLCAQVATKTAGAGTPTGGTTDRTSDGRRPHLRTTAPRTAGPAPAPNTGALLLNGKSKAATAHRRNLTVTLTGSWRGSSVELKLQMQ